jgi:hypothetical protein
MGNRVTAGSLAAEPELRIRSTAIVIQALQQHGHSLLGHGPVGALDPRQRRNQP